ncbi:MAG TPA: OB-fold nucleic acid binding domain-containing protein [Intrasporangium sp.]|uniref:OB-fold nucleic acid binding domain-containing protein n=1 Tax=Intrasporangium sp. TaxID=1925024 RepID=UPI002D784CE7|nr:OB-fold nucleic acid binding domain-containing protein [Intrasporangium sp.]HET7397375.1 OB-fold nucleic acid binding domain-containing protein [Intrasporangium sp.]
MTSGRRRALRRLTEHLTRSSDDIDSDQLKQQSTEAGGVHIGSVRPRSLVTVHGEVRSVTLRPRSDVPALVVDLWDGTDALQLEWLGRRTIPGISPGTRLRATGRVTTHRGVTTIFNPAYEIIGRSGGAHE